MKTLSLALCSVLFCASHLLAAEFEVSEIRSRFNDFGVTALNFNNLHSDTQNEKLVHLGRMLFFDKVLSGNKDISCASCHFPTTGTADNLPISIGTGGQGLAEDRIQMSGHFIPRNAPAAFNLGYPSFHTTMWDQRISVYYVGNKMVLDTPETLINGVSPVRADLAKVITSIAAAQALFPVTSFHEMRGAKGENEIADAKNNIEVWERLTKRLVANEKYATLFKDAYPEIKNVQQLNFAHAAKAIAAFEMASFRADNTDFDAFLSGYDKALTKSQLKGASIFANKGKCLSCHQGPQLTDFNSYSSGMPQLGPGKEKIDPRSDIGEDLGLLLITGNPRDAYKFKTPTLRNVYVTGPWSHSGAYNDLEGFLYHHTNPELGMNRFLETPENYVSSQMFLNLIDYDVLRNQARVNSADVILQNIKLSKNEINDVYQFLKSLTDLGHYHSVRIPETVPSGLSVDP